MDVQKTSENLERTPVGPLVDMQDAATIPLGPGSVPADDYTFPQLVVQGGGQALRSPRSVGSPEQRPIPTTVTEVMAETAQQVSSTDEEMSYSSFQGPSSVFVTRRRGHKVPA